MITLSFDSGVDLVYFREGAANIVYKIKALASSPPSTTSTGPEYDDDEYAPTETEAPVIDPALSGCLLRLRKSNPFAVTVEESQRHFDEVISPLLPPEKIVQQDLVKLTPDLLQHLSQDLRRHETENSRPRHRHGVYFLDGETFGVLVTDMSCSSVEDEAFIPVEFKPKWLIQSPSAPKDSRRCRTCALRAMKSKRSQMEETTKRDFCPLDLASRDHAAFAGAVQVVLEKQRPQLVHEPNTLPLVIESFWQDPILQRLADLQATLDPKGVLATEELDSNFLTAMTVRDCTVFLKVPQSADAGKLQVRLGDLDYKSPGGNKAEYWREIEEQLIDGGWYSGTDSSGNEAPVRDQTCRLSRSI